MLRASCLCAVLILGFAIAANAQPAPPDPWAACQGHLPDANLASRVAGCSTVIAAQGLPDNITATAYFLRANLYLTLRDSDRALADYDSALALIPGDPLVLNNRCWARAIMGKDLQAALADCNDVVARQPKSAVARNSRGFVLLRLGRYADAVRDYDLSLQLNSKPNSVQAQSLFGRGVAEARSGDSTDSDTDIELAKSIAPHIAEVFASFGVQP